MDIMTALSATGKAIDFAKTINSIDTEMSVAEMKAKAAILLCDLADVKIALVEAREQISAKDNEIKILKDAFLMKTRGVRRNEVLYTADEDGNPIGRPYCPRCEQVDGRLIKVVDDRDGARIHTICPQCKVRFTHLQTFSPNRMFNENQRDVAP